jgi:CDP-ribitol ribitolphosphotransferase
MRRHYILRFRIWTVRLAFALARRLPIRRRVVLATAHSSAIRGNLAAIRDELERRRLPIPIVTLIHDPRPGWRGRLLGVTRGIRAAHLMAPSAVFVVDSHYLPLYAIERRPGTTIVQTWHACGAIKKIGYSVLDKRFGVDESVTSIIRLHTNYSLVLAGSQRAVDQYVDAFRQPAELFVTDLGIPRTDILVRPDRHGPVIAAIRARYRLPEGKRVILYAPTFRGTSMTAARHPEDLDIGLLAENLGDDHILLLRLHPAVRSSHELPRSAAGFAIDVTDWPEINELMLVSDVLVTDYSSVIFEFALLGRPMVFFAPDTEDYDDERGFYFDFRTGVPGPVFETSGEVAAFIRAGRFDLDRVGSFAREWFDVADGHAAERFVDRIVLPAVSGGGA